MEIIRVLKTYENRTHTKIVRKSYANGKSAYLKPTEIVRELKTYENRTRT